MLTESAEDIKIVKHKIKDKISFNLCFKKTPPNSVIKFIIAIKLNFLLDNIFLLFWVSKYTFYKIKILKVFYL